MKIIYKILVIILMLLPFGSTFAQENEEEVFVFVEDQPEYTGGDEARKKFLIENMSYPEEAKESGIQGTVYVSFVVEKDGEISSVKVLRGIGGGCDKEAVRVISMMPKWKPGTQRGKAVRAQFNMPIRFILAGDSPSVEKKLSRKEKRQRRRAEKRAKKAEKKKMKTSGFDFE